MNYVQHRFQYTSICYVLCVLSVSVVLILKLLQFIHHLRTIYKPVARSLEKRIDFFLISNSMHSSCRGLIFFYREISETISSSLFYTSSESDLRHRHQSIQHILCSIMCY